MKLHVRWNNLENLFSSHSSEDLWSYSSGKQFVGHFTDFPADISQQLSQFL